MTPQQLATLGAYIASVPEWAALPNNSDTSFFIAAELDKPASPAWTVWRSDVSRDEVSGDGFDWAQVDNLTVGQARIWDWLFDGGTVDAGDAGKRIGISECWKGTAAKVAVATFVLSKCKRNASVIEKLFSTGVGSVASPATMTREGGVSYTEVDQARAL